MPQNVNLGSISVMTNRHVPSGEVPGKCFGYGVYGVEYV